MSKTPMPEEIRFVCDRKKELRSFKEWQAFVEGYSRPANETYVLIKRMTLPLMEAAEDKEKVWKFIKKVSTFTHCPVKLPEYRRMQAYATDATVVETVLKAVSSVGYPYGKKDVLPDVITYYYCAALLSQSEWKREACLTLLQDVLLEAKKKAADGDLGSFEPMLRNMTLLAKEDLKPLLELANEIDRI